MAMKRIFLCINFFGVVTLKGVNCGAALKDADLRTDRQGFKLNTFFLSQITANSDKYSTNHESLINQKGELIVRRHRSAAPAIYQHLADISGGTVFIANKDSISSVVDIIKETFTSSLVILMKFRLTAGASSSFRVPVDDTLSEVIVKIQTLDSPNPIVLVKRPSGVPELFQNSEATRHHLGPWLLVHNITTSRAADFGEWTFNRVMPAEWEVLVSGQSKLDFTYKILEPGPGGYGNYPVKGRPIAGQSVKIAVDVSHYDLIQSVSSVFLLDDTGLPIGAEGLRKTGGRRGQSKFISDTIVIPEEPFKVSIDGEDKAGHRFTRLDPVEVTPLTLTLEVPLHTGTMYVGSSLKVPYNVSNVGRATIKVRIQISDSASFSQSPTHIESDIPSGKFVGGEFMLTSGNTTGITTTMTVTATPVASGVTNGQFEIRRVTVIERPHPTTTIMLPTTTTTMTKPMTSTPQSTSQKPTPPNSSQTSSRVTIRKRSTPRTTLSAISSVSPTSLIQSGAVRKTNVEAMSTKVIVFGSAIGALCCFLPLITLVFLLKRLQLIVKLGSQRIEVDTNSRDESVDAWL